ncbi:hypothetical protein HYW74_05055 [Candidatus Pacearchaeota archaeon]|nr:hypothetical protein [Candidatus Pacearchaeota archaeon]
MRNRRQIKIPKDELKYYWDNQNTWGKKFIGSFSINNGSIDYYPNEDHFNITVQYEVLHLRGALGEMQVCFQYQKRGYTGIVDLFNHWHDRRATNTDRNKLSNIA